MQVQFFFEKKPSGQSVIQYLLLLSIVILLFQMGSTQLPQQWLVNLLQQNVLSPLEASYQFGDPTVKGFESQNPVNHPRIESSGNFRIFMNPQ